jgi:hypothetical protein
MNATRTGTALALGAVGLLTYACGMANEASAGGDYAGGSGGATTTSTTTLPPEQEVESSYGAPVATGNYVWIANPASGRVAFIDATTLEVSVVDAGNGPTYLAAIPDPDDDVAIVLNVLSHDATVLRATGAGVLSAETLPVPETANRWAVSSAGRFATAWTDARDIDDADPLDGFQDIAVLDLAHDASTPLTVGYRPVALGYDDAGTMLFAVTEDGITIVDLAGNEPAVVKNVLLSDDPLEDTSTRDVAITPDGAYALVRRDGVAAVAIFSLVDGSRTDLSLPGPVTDMDLSHDGTVAVAVVRDTSEVALLPIPDVVDDPNAATLFSVSTSTIGSVALADESSLGFLYTNAVPSEVLTVFDSAATPPVPQPILLHAPVKAVFPTPNGDHAVVLHDASSGNYAAAVSLVPVVNQLPSKIVGLEEHLVSVAISPVGDRVLMATGQKGDAAYEMVVAQLPSLKVDAYPLASRPIAAGIVAGAGRGFVAQEHPDGRITFVDFDDGEARTLTGFELAGEVVDGSEP